MMTVTSPGAAMQKPVVLITGAARRIGRAIALRMAAENWAIAVHYRNSRSDAEQLVNEILISGGSASAIGADLTDLNQVAEIIPQCTKMLGLPTCLINNASEFSPDTITSLTPETWNAHLDINLRAPLFLTQAMAAALPPNIEGNVINIIDQRVWNLSADFFSYTISKAGLWTATTTLAQGLAPHIRVNAIGPGPVLKSIHQTEAEFATECASTLLGHGPTAEEIASAVMFILSAKAMTGQMIALDSGQHLT